MDEHAPERPKMEDLRVFLALGIPIFLITLCLVTFVVTVSPTNGQ